MVAGDSYTFGDEAMDADAFPAQLAELTGEEIASRRAAGGRSYHLSFRE